LELREIFEKSWYPLFSAILGFIIGTSLVILLGINPLKVMMILIISLSSRMALSEIAVAFPACLFCALSFLLTFRSGIFNFGTPGQYVLGALCSTIYGILFDYHPLINVPLALLSGFLGGALWALPAAFLKWRRNINEVITTLLLSFTAPIFGIYMVKLPGIKDPTRVNIIASLPVNESTRLPSLMPGAGVNSSLLLALVAAILVYILLWKTRMGIRIRATGLNPMAARYHGIDTDRVMFMTFLLSGGLAGLGGACYILGTAHAYYARTFIGLSGYGLSGIVAAFIGGIHPIGSIFSSLFFSALMVSGLMLNIEAKVPVDYVVLIQGVILAFVAMPLLIREAFRRLGGIK